MPSQSLLPERLDILSRPVSLCGVPKFTYDVNLGNYVDSFDVDEQAITDRLVDRGLTPAQIDSYTLHFDAKSDETNPNTNTAREGVYDYRTRNATLFLGTSALKWAKLAPIADMLETLSTRDDVSTHMTNTVGLPPDELRVQTIELVERIITETIFHETEHFIDHATENTEDDDNYLKNSSSIPITEKAIIFGAIICGSIFSFDTAMPGWPGTAFLPSFLAALYMIWKTRQDKASDTDEQKHLKYLNRPCEIRARAAGDLAPNGLVKLIPKYKMPDIQTIAA